MEMGTLYKVSSLGTRHNTTKASQKLPKDIKAQGDIISKSSWKASTINNSTNYVDPIDAPKIRKPELGVKKP
jgi:hypothetical protein